jgi:hypothetical protein
MNKWEVLKVVFLRLWGGWFASGFDNYIICVLNWPVVYTCSVNPGTMFYVLKSIGALFVLKLRSSLFCKVEEPTCVKARLANVLSGLKSTLGAFCFIS